MHTRTVIWGLIVMITILLAWLAIARHQLAGMIAQSDATTTAQ